MTMVQWGTWRPSGVYCSVDECYKHAPTLIKGQVLPAPVGSGHTSEISVSSTSRAAGSKPVLVPAPERWEVHSSHQSGRDEPRRITMESALPKILILRAALRSSQRSSGVLSG